MSRHALDMRATRVYKKSIALFVKQYFDVLAPIFPLRQRNDRAACLLLIVTAKSSCVGHALVGTAKTNNVSTRGQSRHDSTRFRHDFDTTCR